MHPSQGHLTLWLGSCGILFQKILLPLHWLKHASCGFSFRAFPVLLDKLGSTAQKHPRRYFPHTQETPPQKKTRQVAFSWKCLVDNLRNIPFTPQKGSWNPSFNSHIQWPDLMVYSYRDLWSFPILLSVVPQWCSLNWSPFFLQINHLYAIPPLFRFCMWLENRASQREYKSFSESWLWGRTLVFSICRTLKTHNRGICPGTRV